MNRLKWFAAGLLLSVTAGVLAQVAGGYPSRPTFGFVTVNAAAAATPALRLRTPTAETSGSIQMIDSNTVANVGFIGSGATCTGMSTTDLCVAPGPSGKIVIGIANGAAVFGPVGATLVCSTACSGANMTVGQTVIVNKTVATSRASNITLALDNDLQVLSLPAGTYLAEFVVSFSDASAGGSKVTFWNNGSANSFIYPVVDSLCSGTNAQQLITVAALCAVDANPTYYAMRKSLGTVGAGNAVGVSWSQNTSNATNTTMNSGYLVVTRII